MSHDPRALAKSAGVIEAMRIATEAQRAATRGAAAGWLQREDGSWSVIDEHGREHPMATRVMADDDLANDLAAALAAVAEPVVIDVDPLYSLAVRHALEIAERLARDAGRDQVELDDLRRALANPELNLAARRGGETRDRRTQ